MELLLSSRASGSRLQSWVEVGERREDRSGFAGCEFWEERLRKRFEKLFRYLSGSIDQSIPWACQDWAKGAYRFFANEQAFGSSTYCCTCPLWPITPGSSVHPCRTLGAHQPQCPAARGCALPNGSVLLVPVPNGKSIRRSPTVDSVACRTGARPVRWRNFPDPSPCWRAFGAADDCKKFRYADSTLLFF